MAWTSYVWRIAKGPATIRALRGATGLSRDLVDRLLDKLESKGEVAWTEIKKRGNFCRQYTLSGNEDDSDD